MASLRSIGSRILGLFTRSHQCEGGPLAGSALVLTERSTSTAWVEVRGEIGRYVINSKGDLEWQKRPRRKS